jgi:hypothetical protein
MSRSSFNHIVELMKHNKEFKSNEIRGWKQAPVANQLMLFLRFIGTEGNGASNANQRHIFAIGYGTSENYRRRVTKALLQHRDSFITWPDFNERIAMPKQIHRLFGFPHCVALCNLACRICECYPHKLQVEW